MIWSRETWAATLASSDVYHIEINGRYAGNVILEDRGKGERYLADFSFLPEFQGKGFGKAVLEKVKDRGDKLTAFTRKETLQFFLKSGFVLKRTMRNYFSPGVDRYYITFVQNGNFTAEPPRTQRGIAATKSEARNLKLEISSNDQNSNDLNELEKSYTKILMKF